MLRSRLITLAACLLLAVSIADAASDDASGKPVKRGYTPMPARSMRGGRWFGLDTVDRRSAFSVLSEYDTKGSMIAANAQGRARSKEEFLNGPLSQRVAKYGYEWLQEMQDAKVAAQDGEEETQDNVPDKLLMRDTIYIYREATRKFLEAYNAYQVEKKWKSSGAKNVARQRFAHVVNTYMPALIKFSDNFCKEDVVMTEAEKARAHEAKKQKSGWDTFYSVVKGTLKVARVTLQVMSLNIPELSKELLEITATISETVSAVKDAHDNLQDCVVGKGLGMAAGFTFKQLEKAKEVMAHKTSKNMDAALEAANQVDKAELFKFMTTMTKGLIEHYQNVVEFENLNDDQRAAANTLCDDIFWVRAPVDHSTERFVYLNGVQEFLCKYIEDLHVVLKKRHIFRGSEMESMDDRMSDLVEGRELDLSVGGNRRKLSTLKVMDRLLQQTDSQ